MSADTLDILEGIPGLRASPETVERSFEDDDDDDATMTIENYEDKLRIDSEREGEEPFDWDRALAVPNGRMGSPAYIMASAMAQKLVEESGCRGSATNASGGSDGFRMEEYPSPLGEGVDTRVLSLGGAAGRVVEGGEARPFKRELLPPTAPSYSDDGR